VTPLAASVARGAAFLLTGQDVDGGWRDFDLKPGVATAWTTAYVAARVADLTDVAPKAAPAVEAAAEFLRAHREPGGGWAYNRRCPPDADSTALALLFLAGREPAPRLKDAAVLAAFQESGGGFATYRPWRADHAWARPHAEVTATALRALTVFLPPDHAILRTGRDWLARRAVHLGDAAYWWVTPAYLALELARLGAPDADAEGGDRGATDAFSSALILERSVLRGAAPAAIDAAAGELIARQGSDGSWPSDPILRVPDPARRGPGSIHADQNRLFTTATVVSALNAARHRPD
jgi:hypothetical protein